jgi:D-glycero-D-manno-heptose 1,7-bisphosphate phosphatase
MPSAADAIARLNRHRIPVLLITNQSGIGRGLYTEADFRRVQQRVDSELAAQGARLDGVYHCPHAPDREPPCQCRKPAGGLFLQAAREHGIDLSRSFFLGDRARDLAPAAAFGGTPILVRAGATGATEALPPGSQVVETLKDGVLLVLAALAAD